MIRALQYASGTTKPKEGPVDQTVVDPQAGLVWFECDQPDPERLDTLGTRLGINEFVLEDLRNSGQRTKLDHYSDHFHVAVHDCVAVEQQLVTREIDIVFGDGWLLSVRQAAEGDGDAATSAAPFPIADVQQRFEAHREQDHSSDEGLLLWALLDVVVDRAFTVTEVIDERLDVAEAEVLDDDGDTTSLRRRRPRQIFDLSKTIVEFRRNVAPLREVVGSILRREATMVGDAAIVHFQDLGDHVLRVTELLESQRDVLTNLRDAELAVVSNRMNRSMQQLTAWGAILLIATLVTGVLGMNFGNAPNLDWRDGFLLVGVIIFILSLPMFIYFRRKRWI